MAHEFIYTCYKLGRFYPPDRTILENISLSFYPGAKIGVLGSNGSGKSSLLRIMAGLDDGYSGEARLTPGFTVGLLELAAHPDQWSLVRDDAATEPAFIPHQQEGGDGGPQDARLVPIVAPRRNSRRKDQEPHRYPEEAIQVFRPLQRGIELRRIELWRQLSRGGRRNP